MRTFLYLIFILAIYAPITTIQSQTWAKTYDFGKSESFYGVALGPDKSLLVTGSKWDYNNLHAPVITIVARLDSLGDLMWSKEINIGNDGGSYQAMEAFAINNGDNFIVFANPYEAISDNSYSDIAIFSISKDGEILWTKLYGGEETDLLKSVTLMPKGNFIMGYVANDHKDMLISEVDASGTLLWTTKIADPDFYISRVEPFYLEGFIAIGTEPTLMDFVIKRLDASGNELWSKIYGSSDRDVAHEVAVSGNGHIYALGYTRSHPSNRIMVQDIDKDGDLLNTILYPSQNYGGHYYPPPMSLTGMCDGNFIATSVHESFTPDHNPARIMRFDEEFTLVWDTLIQDSEHQYRLYNCLQYSAEECNFRGSGAPDYNPPIVCVGSRYSYHGGSNAYVIKLEAGGTRTPNVPDLPAMARMNVSPNPGNDIIHLSSSISHIASARVYTISGKLLQIENFEDDEHVYPLYVGRLLQGVYLIVGYGTDGQYIDHLTWIKQ